MAEIEHTKYSRENLNIDYYKSLLRQDIADYWLEKLEDLLPAVTKRTSTLIGDEGLIYKVTYRGQTSSRAVLPWDAIEDLSELKAYVEGVTGQKMTVCVIQQYPAGKTGIKPHRDKEMVWGTKICGISLGATRILSLSRTGYESIDIPLEAGSLYVLNNPTNQYWLHSIVQDNSIKSSRISLTFRNYKN